VVQVCNLIKRRTAVHLWVCVEASFLSPAASNDTVPSGRRISDALPSVMLADFSLLSATFSQPLFFIYVVASVYHQPPAMALLHWADDSATHCHL
jgi:hypothetical protein